MKKNQKNLLISLSLFSTILLSTGCAPKNSDGSYASAYSYHPYLKKSKRYNKATYKTAYYPKRTNSYALSSIKTIPNPYQYKQEKRPIINKATYKTVYQPKRTNTYALSSIKTIPNPYQYRQDTRLISNIERTAKSLLGTDYQYGANGPYQYDCSSFTKHVFEKQGIHLPRVSKEQAQRGQYVRAEQLKKGDLVFFDSKKSTQVSHVGIYLGKGDFIHASSAQDKVTISNLNSNYYSKHFKWGRRVSNVNYAMR